MITEQNMYLTLFSIEIELNFYTEIKFSYAIKCGFYAYIKMWINVKQTKIAFWNYHILLIGSLCNISFSHLNSFFCSSPKIPTFFPPFWLCFLQILFTIRISFVFELKLAFSVLVQFYKFISSCKIPTEYFLINNISMVTNDLSNQISVQVICYANGTFSFHNSFKSYIYCKH